MVSRSHSQGLTIGGATAGSIVVDGVDLTSSDSVGLISLVASRDGSTVTFANTPSSFDKGVVVQGMAGVTLDTDLTTKGSETALNSGTGTLTVSSGQVLSTSGQVLTMTVDNIDLRGSITSGDST